MMTKITAALDDLFATARQNESALTVALCAKDDVAGMIAASRLRLALSRAREAFEAAFIDAPIRRAAVRAVFQESTRGMQELLERAPRQSRTRDPERLTRWIIASRRSTNAACGPDLFELDVTGVPLIGAVFFGLHVARCRFITDMRRAAFQDAFVDRSDFTYGNLHSTLWHATTVRHSFLRDATLADATFNRTTFIDCDLRRADLSITANRRTGSVGGTEFVRCDLRGTNWSGRDLTTLTMIDCQLDGIENIDAFASQRMNQGARSQRSEIPGRLAGNPN